MAQLAASLVLLANRYPLPSLILLALIIYLAVLSLSLAVSHLLPPPQKISRLFYCGCAALMIAAAILAGLADQEGSALFFYLAVALFSTSLAATYWSLLDAGSLSDEEDSDDDNRGGGGDDDPPPINWDDFDRARDSWPSSSFC